MKNQKPIFIILTIVILGTVLYAVSTRTIPSDLQQIDSNQSKQNNLSSQKLTDGTVVYTITPKNIDAASATWDFDITLDTHTGSLDQDLVSLVRLVDDKGNEYQATKWEGDPPGGHHREGVLKFAPISPRPSFIVVNIKPATTSEKTNLRWNL